MLGLAGKATTAHLSSPSRRSMRTPATAAAIYPEWGTYPGGDGESPIIPNYDPKNAERELIHGRFAMLAVTGAFTQEQLTGIPWYEAGSLCTPDDCGALIDAFPLAIQGVNAPSETGDFYYFGYVIFHQVLLFGMAEVFRTGLQPFGDSEPIANPFPELTRSGNPGGRFDPLGLAEKYDLEELKIKELKHGRLSMVAWLGCIGQSIATQEGPYKNLMDHRADPTHANAIFNVGKTWM